jgi:hypothetical protein
MKYARIVATNVATTVYISKFLPICSSLRISITIIPTEKSGTEKNNFLLTLLKYFKEVVMNKILAKMAKNKLIQLSNTEGVTRVL